ncbi:unnamed protein product [Dicrocoelium dendriticum]|nr:unnamed protein product [Dicrocoelium dendriticum]
MRTIEMLTYRNICLLTALTKWLKGTHCFTFLKRRLPVTVARALDRLLSLRCKLTVERTRRDFYEGCIRSCCFPRRFAKTLSSNKLPINNTNLARVASAHIDACLERERKFLETQRRFACVLKDLSLVCRLKFEVFSADIIRRTRTKTVRNLQGSLAKAPNAAFPTECLKHVYNLSSVHFTRTQMEVLSLGLKYRLPPKAIDKLNTQAQFEYLNEQLSDHTPRSMEDAGWFRAKLVDIANQYLNTPISQRCCLKAEHYTAIKELKQMGHLMFLQPDKGSGIVIMDRSDYVAKMESILRDRRKFQLDKTPENNILVEKQVARKLQILLLHGYINDSQYRRLKPTGTQTPRMRGAPKLHKAGNPLRPIMCMNNSPYHNVARWLAKMLEPVRKLLTTYCLKDSFELVETLEHVSLGAEHMYSIDVDSLFTNVPLRETVENLCDFIASQNMSVGLPLEYLRDMILLCTENIRFEFEGTAYKQIDGVAMGSPLGPVLADIFLGLIERQVTASICEATLYKRYVDDILVFTTDEHFARLLEALNSIHPNLSVSHELEQHDSLPFLDILIKRRTDGTLQRTVHRKATWSGQYLHFSSFAPVAYKRGLVKTLFYRARRICSPEMLQAEEEFLFKTLVSNGYPEKFVQIHSRPPKEKIPVLTAEKKNVYLFLPFKGDHVSNDIGHKLRSAVTRTYATAQLRLIHTTRSLVLHNRQSNSSVSSASHVVYQFTCGCGDIYIGRTDRQLAQRVAEHVPRWLEQLMTQQNGVDPRMNRSPASSITKHLLATRHQVNPETAFKVLLRNNNPLILAISEALLIKAYQPALCAQKLLRQSIKLPWS